MQRTTITVSKDLRKKLMLLKIKSGARSIDEVLNRLLDKLKEVSGPGKVKDQGEALLS